MDNLPFAIDFVTDGMVEKAEKELGETPEMKKEALIKLRNSIKDDSKLTRIPLDDHYLLQFLRVRKFNVKRAISLLHNYYNVKTNNPDTYGPEFPNFRKTATDRIVNVLPYRDKDGAVIIIAQMQNWNVNETKFSSLIHGITLALILSVDLYTATQICGVKIIIDTKGLSLKHMRYISPRQIHILAKGLTNSLPIRFKEIHVYNESVIIQYVWNIIKLVLTEKIKNRVHFHASNLKGIHKYIDTALLPEEYGGSLQYDNSFWVKIIDDFRERYFELITAGPKSRKSSREDQ